MPKMRDLTGTKFNRLTVLGISHRVKKDVYWHCRCDCGNTSIVSRGAINNKSTISCGCYLRERMTEVFTTHGMSSTSIYTTWQNIIIRCTKPSSISYKHYGARGIKVCERWSGSFENFYADMGAGWFLGASIERLDINKDYELSNCTWIPLGHQARNKSTSVFIDTPWGRLSAHDAAAKIGIAPGALYSRIARWPEERWFMPPNENRLKRYRKNNSVV